jgi:hypothetical protein
LDRGSIDTDGGQRTRPLRGAWGRGRCFWLLTPVALRAPKLPRPLTDVNNRGIIENVGAATRQIYSHRAGTGYSHRRNPHQNKSRQNHGRSDPQVDRNPDKLKTCW